MSHTILTKNYVAADKVVFIIYLATIIVCTHGIMRFQFLEYPSNGEPRTPSLDAQNEP